MNRFVSGWCGFPELFNGLDGWDFYVPFHDDERDVFAMTGENLVCWSTGANLALKAENLNYKNIILAAPFINFTDFTPERILKRMIKRFESDPAKVIADFQTACACPEVYVPEQRNDGRLISGLEYLLDSGQGINTSLTGFKVLHGENDAIVSPEAGRKIAEMFGAEFILVRDCGHYIAPAVISEYLI